MRGKPERYREQKRAAVGAAWGYHRGIIGDSISLGLQKKQEAEKEKSFSVPFTKG